MNHTKTGYTLGVAATALLLIWIGIFKFTPTEAAGIKPLVENSFLMSWTYKIGTVQQVSNFIGFFEIVTGTLLVSSFWQSKAGLIGGYLTLIIFLTTLSFLATTPCVWKTVDGVPTTDFFVVKDLGYLAIGLMVIGTNSPKK
ncbi:DUF417 family protein [Mucilaginibacter psychrotolerans]|uniref:DUF417 family protein n=1 Tax=Mucilaginibacter psychrotolerans TaxID=1524096 RepID=A0A4Y8S6W1_9SPHI|nr:DUF417 family protein [Mucilaginibacter psychrotolerans]TFF34753.1 DUF417 family protein [Mucilaginibacter psychrotolerans]